jgi:transcriptional regulator with XRE-family HTH domain
MTSTAFYRLRRRLGLSQPKLARLLGVAPNTVARMERGEMGISVPMARLLLFVAQDIEAGRGYAEYLAVIDARKEKQNAT